MPGSMLDIMSVANNAIATYNSALQVHSGNIANMSVPGYKGLDVSFQSLFEQVIRNGSAASSFSSTGGTNPLQMGQGVGISSVNVNMTQGSQSQGNTIDLAINGQGFFIVSEDGSNFRYTRAGKFNIVGGRLVTEAGMQVYGLNSVGSRVAITGLTGAISNYTWTTSGELQLSGANTGYRAALTYFSNPSGLLQAEGTTFKETISSGAPATAIASGGAAGYVTGGYLEQSNVNYLGESLDSLELQRAMSANLSVAKMASDIIAQFISKLG